MGKPEHRSMILSEANITTTCQEIKTMKETRKHGSSCCSVLEYLPSIPVLFTSPPGRHQLGSSVHTPACMCSA